MIALYTNRWVRSSGGNGAELSSLPLPCRRGASWQTAAPPRRHCCPRLRFGCPCTAAGRGVRTDVFTSFIAWATLCVAHAQTKGGVLCAARAAREPTRRAPYQPVYFGALPLGRASKARAQGRRASKKGRRGRRGRRRRWRFVQPAQCRATTTIRKEKGEAADDARHYDAA